VLGHQPFDFGKDFWRSLLVLKRKTGVKEDTVWDVGEEGGVGYHMFEVQVSQNSHPTKS